MREWYNVHLLSEGSRHNETSFENTYQQLDAPISRKQCPGPSLVDHG